MPRTDLPPPAANSDQTELATTSQPPSSPPPGGRGAGGEGALLDSLAQVPLPLPVQSPSHPASFETPISNPGAPGENPLLTPDQQTAYVHLLTGGASPLRACQRLGVTVADVLRTLDLDLGFRALVDQAGQVLSGNVAAALYHKAMNGNVPAQTFFLRHRPPTDWKDPGETAADNFDELTNAELLARCLAEGIAVPLEAQALLGPQPGAPSA